MHFMYVVQIINRQGAEVCLVQLCVFVVTTLTVACFIHRLKKVCTILICLKMKLMDCSASTLFKSYCMVMYIWLFILAFLAS